MNVIGNSLRIILTAALVCAAATFTVAQSSEDPSAIIKRAVEKLGGEKYLKVSSQVSRGRYSIFRDGSVVSSQTFIDVIVFPDKERTDFKSGKTRYNQTNVGGSGWIFDGDQELIRVQTQVQIDNFKRGMRVSIDNLLRGGWQGAGKLSYAGRRPASLGKRNDVVKLAYDDGLVVEFEFSDDGMPAKAVYKAVNADGEEVVEEDRYAQFVDVGGIRTPYIVDRFSGGKPASRINYESVEFNVRVPESVFEKPASLKDAKRDIKL